MSAHGCCVDGVPRSRSLVRRGANASGWVVPGAILVLMPKCPACVVAYIAIATGAGISFSAAAQMRMAVLGVCVAVLVVLAVRLMRSARDIACRLGPLRVGRSLRDLYTPSGGAPDGRED
ncbi:MAG TPA: hypothetical protein VK627_11210 [Edaphobacter sp.]|nr:hypothetical protein [Edaphobacter sp.]